MKNNPVVPFILIFALGLGLIFFMSLYGVDQKKEIAGADEEGKTEETASNAEEFDPEGFTQQKCIACHGGDLTGGAGPNLHGLSESKEKIHEIIKNGQGGMPAFGGQISDEQIDQLADYILTLK
ncbi:cytochrome c-550 [Sporosarcina sp. NCCP-2222]|uniref:cytochrome c550 n=1 Tax=Sporosarcina sp. NCCP-2222 TaxID=2935073 RepID=UPI00208A48F5|nr:cytochrome c [Sporosarcina sp. NCCP-2222]GKV54315.1 cytochrome c-550 [Sporosarcina sp. NCCP-2222]